MSGRVQFECRISRYLEKVDPELYALIDAVCLTGTLDNSRSGVTFMWPKDVKDFKPKLQKLIYSSNHEDVDKGVDLINAHILKARLTTPHDWEAQKADIPNSQYPSHRVKVAGVKGDTISLEGGITAKYDTGFKPMRTDAMAVMIVDGIMPTTGEKSEAIKMRGKMMKRGNKVGSYDGGSDEAASACAARKQILEIAASQFALKQSGIASKIGGRDISGAPWNKLGSRGNIFVEYALSLAHYVLERDASLGRLIALQISFTAGDLPVLLQVGFHGKPMIPNDMVDGWWLGYKQGAKSLSQVVSDLRACLAENDPDCASLNAAQRGGMHSHIDAVRVAVADACSDNKRISLIAASQPYEELMANNAIPGVSKVMPSELHSYYQNHKWLKLAQDEVRFIMYKRIAAMQSNGNTGDLGELLTRICRCLNHKLDHCLPFGASMNSDATQQAGTIWCHFVNSTLYLYFPMSDSEYASLPDSVPYMPSESEFNDGKLWNIGFEATDGLSRETEADEASRLETLKRLLDSPQLIAKLPSELRAKIAQ
jgi:hypothetical protein